MIFCTICIFSILVNIRLIIWYLELRFYECCHSNTSYFVYHLWSHFLWQLYFLSTAGSQLEIGIRPFSISFLLKLYHLFQLRTVSLFWLTTTEPLSPPYFSFQWSRSKIRESTKIMSLRAKHKKSDTNKDGNINK